MLESETLTVAIFLAYFCQYSSLRGWQLTPVHRTSSMARSAATRRGILPSRTRTSAHIHSRMLGPFRGMRRSTSRSIRLSWLLFVSLFAHTDQPDTSQPRRSTMHTSNHRRHPRRPASHFSQSSRSQSATDVMVAASFPFPLALAVTLVHVTLCPFALPPWITGVPCTDD